MGTCFVMQPFDNGQFDKRYNDVFAPAIKAADLEPYRVDQDPGVSIPIDHIETSIRSAMICFAEITTNNPNVWFELGYAIASQKEVVLVCSFERTTPFPFDIQHRSIIKYSTQSISDFEKLQEEITAKLIALQGKATSLKQMVTFSPIADFSGLSQIEIATLVSIAENVEHISDSVNTSNVRYDMERLGFRKVATTLGLELLSRKGFVRAYRAEDEMGDVYKLCELTDLGINWLLSNQDKIKLYSPNTGQSDDDIPF